jgi:thioredoxin-like negative regulator of GroEL
MEQNMKKAAIVMFVLLALVQVAAAVEFTGTYAEAKAQAVSQNKPILIDFFAEWCGPCKQFAAAVGSNAEIQKALEPVILYRVDSEKGAGKDLAKEFSVRAYPTFIMVNKDGQMLDIWLGYEKSSFIKIIADAQTDLSTIDEKKARYKTLPDMRSAIVLGRYSAAMGEFKEAVDYYRMAHVLSSDTQSDYSFEIFENTASGIGKNIFTYDDVSQAAEAIINGPKRDVWETIQVSNEMIGIAKNLNKPDDVAKYIQVGLDATSVSDDPDIKNTHSELMVEFALSVKHDTATAVEYKKAVMPEGWQQDAGKLNEFAWWCFENKTNLTEAEQLARKSIELAKPGREKADCYDTLAEIVNAKGNPKEALELSQKAVAEVPANKYFPTQVERFEKAVTPTK